MAVEEDGHNKLTFEIGDVSNVDSIVERGLVAVKGVCFW